jgi:hypothetical protein
MSAARLDSLLYCWRKRLLKSPRILALISAIFGVILPVASQHLQGLPVYGLTFVPLQTGQATNSSDSHALGFGLTPG